MDTGRVIKLKSSYTRKIRNNLRKLFLTAAKEKFHKAIDLGEDQLAFENIIGVQKINKTADELYKLFYNSICMCRICRNSDKDAVFIGSDLMNQFVYPPFEDDKEGFHSFWICPDCYKELIKKVEYYQNNRYYYLRDYCIFDSLENLGIESLDEINKLKTDF